MFRIEQRHQKYEKLLKKQRRLEVERMKVEVVIHPYQDTYLIQVCSGDLQKFNTIDMKFIKWELIDKQSKKKFDIKLSKIFNKNKQIYVIKKPPKYMKSGPFHYYDLVTANSTIHRELQGLQSNLADPQILAYINNLKMRTIPKQQTPYYDQSVFNGLNDSQKKAIKFALEHKISLIKGPPGTGKTTIIARLVKLFSQKGLKVLVCGPSNSSTDSVSKAIMSKIENPQLMTRFCSELKNNQIAKQLLSVNFPNKVLKLLSNVYKPNQIYYKWFHQNLVRFINKENIKEHFKETELSKQHFQVIRQRLYDQTIEHYTQILCCTLITSASNVLQKFRPDILIVDEATQAIQPELIVALNKGAQKVILIGDQIQLAPTVISNDETLKQSTFKRLIQNKPQVCRILDIQYRMTPIIADFASFEFYNGLIKNGIKSQDRKPNIKMFDECPIVIIGHNQKQKSIETSYLNLKQIEIIEQILKKFPEQQLRNIGIITGLKPQEHQLKQRFKQSIKKGLEINTFDGYQGNQKEYIIISFVRSNQNSQIGFLESANRANVAITRAKRGLVLVGNKSTMCSDNNSKYNPWKRLIQYVNQLNRIKQIQLKRINDKRKDQSSKSNKIIANQQIEKQIKQTKIKNEENKKNIPIQEQKLSTVQKKKKSKKNNWQPFPLF